MYIIIGLSLIWLTILAKRLYMSCIFVFDFVCGCMILDSPLPCDYRSNELCGTREICSYRYEKRGVLMFTNVH